MLPTVGSLRPKVNVDGVNVGSPMTLSTEASSTVLSEGMDVVLRLSDDEAQRLAEQAEREQRSLDDVVRTAVADYLRRSHEQRVREVLDEELPRYQGLLDRLKET